MFTVKYNRATNHIDGLTVRTTGGGNDVGDHVSDYAQNACPSLTRYRFAQGATLNTVAEALDAARKAGGRKLCRHCEKAAEAMIAAEAVPTHVSSLVESAAHDDDDNEGVTTMAAKATKLKLKDVRGDIRIGSATGSNGSLHALKPELDAEGRNVTYCPTKFKTPVRSFGPAMEQKPELELCAGCSKVVPTGDVIVTVEPVKIPGINLTVNQKKIMPVEGTNEGESDMAAKNNTQDTDAAISAVHDDVDAIKSAETAEAVEELAGQAEARITALPTKHRTSLRATVAAATKARKAELNPEPAAPGTDVETKPTAEVAEDFNKFDGVPELVKDGVKLFSEGINLGMKLGTVGEKLAHTMLTMRQKIVNPETGLPDLPAGRKTTKNAAAEVYAQAKKAIADDDVDRQAAHNSLVRATQNKASDVLVDWIRSFDGPDRKESLAVAKELFGDRLDGLKDDESITEAVYRLYAEQGIELPRYGRTELARYDRRVKAIESAQKEREALVESSDPGAGMELERVEATIADLKAEVPEAILAEKLQPKAEKSEAEKAAEALAQVKAAMDKAGKRFSKVKGAAEKRKAKAELYGIIRAAADTFDLDLSALVTADDEA